MRLLSPVSPPEVTQDSIQRMTRSFGRWIGLGQGCLDWTTRTSPLGRLMRQRTQAINALRAHMAELGIVAAPRRGGVKGVRGGHSGDRDEPLPLAARAHLSGLA